MNIQYPSDTNIPALLQMVNKSHVKLAAILMNCDVVIGPMTATAMLAGSLGKHTICVVNRHNPVTGGIETGSKGAHYWLENGTLYVFDSQNKIAVLNRLIGDLLSDPIP